MKERRTEVIARRIVEAALGVPLRPADHNLGYAVHDYDVLFPGEDPGALEVFVAAKQDDVARSSLHSKYASAGFESEHLTRSWVVSVGASATFKGWGERLEAFLLQVERMGIERLTIEDCYWRRELLDEALAIDVQIAHAFDSSQTGRRVFLSTGYGGTAGNADDGAAELQLLLWATEDVRHKLQRSGRICREAFVLAHLSHFSLWSPLEEGLPTLPIELPPEMTGAWIARGDGLGWRFQPAAGWSSLPLIPGIGENLPDR